MKKSSQSSRVPIATKLNASLNLAIFKEGRTYVAYSPALDLAAQGKSVANAQKNFQEVFEIYLEETLKKGTLEKDLLRCGWHKRGDSMEPPTLSSLPSAEKLGKNIELTALAIIPLDQKRFICRA